MKGIGTIINVIAILGGGGLGLLLRGGISERFKQIMMQACALATMFIGIAGAFELIFTVGEDGRLSSGSTMLILLSLVIGGLIGEAINIEKRLDDLGVRLRGLIRSSGDNKFVDGFVTMSLVACVGAMAICGPLEEGLTGTSDTLLVKSILDLVTSLVFASVYGVGVLFAGLVVGVYQGAITLLAAFIEPYMSDRLILSLSGVGAVMIFALGFNLLFPKKVRVGNFLPALLVPIVYELILMIPIFK